ncbi:hypothetical protein ACFE04_015337 [Oxalis oulophora]
MNIKKSKPLTNPFDLLSQELIITIITHLTNDPFTQKSLSQTCKAFHFLESQTRKTLKPATSTSPLLTKTLKRYPFISHIDFSLMPRVTDQTLTLISSSSPTLHSINLSKSKFYTTKGLSSLVTNCANLKELDLSNGVNLGDVAASVIGQARNLEKLWLSRCKLVTDIGIGCVAVGCRKLKLLCLRWCLCVGDLGVGLVALKCKEIQSLDFSYLPITEKCLPSILQLPNLEDLVLEGCTGIDYDGLVTLKTRGTLLKRLDLSHCQDISPIGLSSLTNGAESLQQLSLANGPALTADLAKCLQTLTGLQLIKLDSCPVTTCGLREISKWQAKLKECCKYLEELDVTDNEIDDEGLKYISRCSRLASLKLGICLNITDKGLWHIGLGCSKLKELDFYRSPGVTDVGIEAISQGCPLLEMINISYNEKITDASLMSLSKCVRLKVLEIRGCPFVSSQGLAAIASGCRQLSVLDIKKCFNINDQGMLTLSQYSPNLKQINMSYCQVTDMGLLALTSLNRLQNMTILHLAGLTPNGLVAALLASKGLAKMKLHVHFKPLIPLSVIDHMEASGCVFQWRNKPLEMNMDSERWKQFMGK